MEFFKYFPQKLLTFSNYFLVQNRLFHFIIASKISKFYKKITPKRPSNFNFAWSSIYYYAQIIDYNPRGGFEAKRSSTTLYLKGFPCPSHRCP